VALQRFREKVKGQDNEAATVEYRHVEPDR
jgi:hypothetical protein